MTSISSSWSALRLASNLTARLAKRKIFEPTAVQTAALGALMPPKHRLPGVQPSDAAVIRWPTGSGKTLAFALPLLSRIDVHS